MVKSGSENRRRRITLKARFTESEAAVIQEQAGRAGVSVASVLRYAALNQTPLPVSRRPSVDHEIAARLLGKMGQCAAALREAADAQNPAEIDTRIIAAHRDLAEMRLALLEALGRQP